MIKAEQFSTIFPKVDLKFVVILNQLLQLHELKTLERVSMFLAQCGHESGNFKIFIENLNYSAEALLTTFHKYFNESDAKLFARKPQAIANRVYANRMGNGPEESGDGWKFRGRGLIQLTGKNNYTDLAKYCNQTVDEAVKYCETFEGIVDSAIFFWIKNQCNDFADKNDFVGLTKKINGGTNGLYHRQCLYELIKKTLKIE